MDDQVERAKLLLKARQLQEKSLPGQPGVAGIGTLGPGTEEQPLETNLYGGDLERAASSFGNLAGNAPEIQKQGFTDVKRNKAGDIIARSKANQNWFRDAQGIKHPLNWLEAHAGGILPTLGMGTGGALAGIPGAAGGAAVGEAARAGIGKLLGNYEGTPSQLAMDVAGEGASGAASELGGKLLGAAASRIPVPGIGMSVSDAARAALEKAVYGPGRTLLSKFGGAMTGVPSEAIERTMVRPNEVMNSMAPENVLNVARQGGEELGQASSKAGEAISQARQDFAKKYGHQPIDTTEAMQAVNEAASRNAPNQYGESALSPQDFESLQGLKKSLGDVQQENNGTGVVTGNGTKPKQLASSLQRTIDMLNEQKIPGNYYTASGAARTRSPKMAGVNARVAGLAKKSLQKASPELAAADQAYSNFADNQKMLAGLENPLTMESLTANMFGKNRGAMQEAAAQTIPQTYEKMADMGAYKSFGKTNRIQSVLGPSSPAILPIAASLAAGGITHSPSIGALVGGGTLGAELLTSPTAAKYGAYLSGLNLQPGRIPPWLLLQQLDKLKEQ